MRKFLPENDANALPDHTGHQNLDFAIEHLHSTLYQGRIEGLQMILQSLQFDTCLKTRFEVTSRLEQ